MGLEKPHPNLGWDVRGSVCWERNMESVVTQILTLRWSPTMTDTVGTRGGEVHLRSPLSEGGPPKEGGDR